MLKKINSEGRIVIPAPYLKELGIEADQELDVEKAGNKIIISNPAGMRSKEEIEKMYEDISNLANRSEYDKGFEDALKMVLNK